MDLENASAQALSDLKALLADLAEAGGALEEQQEALEETKEQIEAGASGLAEDARSLLRLAAEAQQRLGEDARDAAVHLDLLSQKVRSVHAQAGQALAGSEASLAALEPRTTALEARLDALFRQLESASAILRAQTHGGRAQILATSAAARAFLDQAASDFGRFEQALAQRLDRLRAHVEDVCVPTLEALAEAWQASLEGAVANIADQGVRAAASNLEQVRAKVMEECGAGCQPLLDEVAELGDRLEAALARLGASFERAQASLEAGGPALEGLRQVSPDLQVAQDALAQVKGVLARYTFVTM